jgi:two-component system response regulator PilR (NtrC family)
LETELFGCRKGAYSGALESRKGLVAEAEGGTLFLDEIAEISLSMQAKLLAFIERRVYRPVGESREIQADVRIIAATNRNLSDEVTGGRFRQDLYFRLNTLPIWIPPLRKRREDILSLVASFSHLLRGVQLDEACLRLLQDHLWPGNVRELIQVLRRCGVMGDDLSPIESLREILGESGLNGNETRQEADPPDHYDQDLAQGLTFWQGPWQDFLDRRINRGQLRLFLTRRYEQVDSLRALAESLNLAPRDYPRFVSALHKYRIHPVLHKHR